MDDTTTIDDRRTASPGSGDGEEDDATTVKVLILRLQAFDQGKLYGSTNQTDASSPIDS